MYLSWYAGRALVGVRVGRSAPDTGVDSMAARSANQPSVVGVSARPETPAGESLWARSHLRSADSSPWFTRYPSAPAGTGREMKRPRFSAAAIRVAALG